MAETEKPRQKTNESLISIAKDKKVNPLAAAGSGVFIVGFLAGVIAIQQFPASWFVQTFLRGYRGYLVGLLFWCAVMSAVALIESQMTRRKAKSGRTVERQ